jgi:ABC-type multidrug transport system fused ATPase/permease subunit
LNIGRAADNDIVLSGAGVSRHHARLTLTPHSQPVIADIGSTNGTYVNGDLLRAPRSLEADDVVFLGGFLFRVDGATIHQIDLGASRISAFSLSKEYSGEPVMSDISLALLPGEFVGLMGPSGCGKSTLMDALDGLQPAPVGSVFLGDFDLYRNFGSVRRSIGHVPQHDVLHDDLSVERTLLYAARLRLPATTQRAQIRAVVADVVNMVSLQDKLATPFRQCRRSCSSTSQRRRSTPKRPRT